MWFNGFLNEPKDKVVDTGIAEDDPIYVVDDAAGAVHCFNDEADFDNPDNETALTLNRAAQIYALLAAKDIENSKRGAIDQKGPSSGPAVLLLCRHDIECMVGTPLGPKVLFLVVLSAPWGIGAGYLPIPNLLFPKQRLR